METEHGTLSIIHVIHRHQVKVISFNRELGQSTKDNMVAMTRNLVATPRAAMAKSHNKARLLASSSIGPAEVLDSCACSGRGERSGVEVERTRRSRGLRVRIGHRTVVIPGLGNHSEALLVDWTDGTSVWQWPVYVHVVGCPILGGGKTRVKLDNGLSFFLGARKEEWSLSGGGLGWFIDAQ